MPDSTQVASGQGVITVQSAGDQTGVLTFVPNSISITNCDATVTADKFVAVPSQLTDQPYPSTQQDVNYQYGGPTNPSESPGGPPTLPTGSSTVILNPAANSNPIGAANTSSLISGGNLLIWDNTGGRDSSNLITKGSMTYKPNVR